MFSTKLESRSLETVAKKIVKNSFFLISPNLPTGFNGFILKLYKACGIHRVRVNTLKATIDGMFWFKNLADWRPDLIFWTFNELQIWVGPQLKAYVYYMAVPSWLKYRN